MFSLPAISRLLVQGGDERIALQPGNGANRYGVSPEVQTGRVEFSSSTASHLSLDAWGAIDRFRQRVNQALESESPEALWQREERRLRASFLDIWGLPQAHTLWQCLRSGTDAHSLASVLAFRRFGRPFRIITGDLGESGSKVSRALLNGSRAVASECREDAQDMASLVEIPVRNPDGSCRAIKSIDQDFYQAALVAIRQDIPVLMIRVDESKSGCLYPSLDLLTMLSTRSPEMVAVMVDCSQLRCSPAQLETYLDAGFLVAASGSKFYGAPAFCTALLAGPGWCDAWPGSTTDLDEQGQPNFGLLARWEAALYTMARYQRIPDTLRASVVAHFQRAVQEGIAGLRSLELLDANRDGRSEARTLFALRACRIGAGGRVRSLLPQEVEQVYRALQSSRPGRPHGYALGQPVPCRGRDYQRTQYLRISLSAPMLIELCRMADEERLPWLRNEINLALLALDDEIGRIGLST